MTILIIILLKLYSKKLKIEMDRDIPVFNRPVMQKIFRKNQQKHLQRLRNIKTGNGNRTMPINQNHTLSNKKAILAEQQKRTEIEKQNVLLFNKMMRIMKRNDPNNQPNLTQFGRLTKIESENSRIVQQNRGILERIEHQKPTISNKKLQQDRMKNINILRFLGKYPNANITGSRTNYDSMSSQMGRKTQINKRKYDSYYNRGNQLQDFQLDQELYEEQIRTYQMQVQKLKERSLPSSSGRRKYQSQAVNRANVNNKMDSQQSQGLGKLASVDVPVQIPYHQQRVQQRQHSKASATKSDNESQHPTQFSSHSYHHANPSKQIILFQKASLINKGKALVQIIRLYNIYKIRAVFQQPIKGNRIYQLEIPEQEGNQFFSQNNYDYHRVCKMLVIEDGCLVVNPNLADREERQVKQVKEDRISIKEKNNRNQQSGKDRDGSERGEEVKPSEKIVYQNQDSRLHNAGEGQHWGKYQQALEEYIQ